MRRASLVGVVARLTTLVLTAAGCGVGRPLAADADTGLGGTLGSGGRGGGTGLGGAGGGASGGRGGVGGDAPKTRDFDILFMIDNSSLMQPTQTLLINSFPRFHNALAALPGGLPNLHIAVISSDMGAGVGIQNCGGFGNNGVFQFTPRGGCTDTTLGAATFIVNYNGLPNYNGSLDSVLSCIANLGTSGCGLEQPLLSISRALGADGLDTPAENQGFLRPGADLVIIILSNEDDCSAREGANSQLFSNISPNSLASPFGPVGSFRCNEFGHICNGVVPNRNAPNNMPNDMVSYTNCVSNENSTQIKSVASFVDEIRSLKSAYNQILVAAIVGVPAGNPSGAIPYTVTWSPAPLPDTGPWPHAAPSCSTATLFGDPAIRLAQFARAFGDRGLLFSICDGDYGPAMDTIAESIGLRAAP